MAIGHWPPKLIEIQDAEIAAISDDGKFVVTWDMTFQYALWRVNADEKRLEKIPGLNVSASSEGPRAIFSPDNKTLVMSSRSGCTVARIRPTPKSYEVSVWHDGELPCTADVSFEFSADGSILVILCPFPAISTALKFVERPSFRALKLEPPSYADDVMRYQCLMPGYIALGCADVDGTYKSWLLSPEWRYIHLHGTDVMLSLTRRFLADFSSTSVRFYDLQRDWTSQTFRTEVWIKGIGRVTGVSYPDRGFIPDGSGFEPDSGTL
jgi:WD40 repeat protein